MWIKVVAQGIESRFVILVSGICDRFEFLGGPKASLNPLVAAYRWRRSDADSYYWDRSAMPWIFTRCSQDRQSVVTEGLAPALERLSHGLFCGIKRATEPIRRIGRAEARVAEGQFPQNGCRSTPRGLRRCSRSGGSLGTSIIGKPPAYVIECASIRTTKALLKRPAPGSGPVLHLASSMAEFVDAG
jgi:hypothetical protein